jgi:hypothetical protein
MRRSLVLLALVSIVTASLTGCMASGGASPVAFAPRSYAFLPQPSPEMMISK